jgi:mono/diheme cytochrome c family protein
MAGVKMIPLVVEACRESPDQTFADRRHGNGNRVLMWNKNTGLLGLLLIAVGAIGLFAMATVFAAQPGPNRFTSTGQRVYYTGADVAGRPIPRTIAGGGVMGFGMMGAAACVDCHGEDGRGGRVGMMFGVLDIPDIRYSDLTSVRSEDGTTVAAWTDAQIARAIRDGVEPNGEPLKAPMPRWDMTDVQLADMIAYLKELDRR